jgi:16S rRNA (adenine1518-N6/adenine1519-N6)-dimethyltransferase
VPAKKALGQHFLHDPRLLGRIAEAVGIEPGDRVLEVGPGRGALTAELLARGAQVTAIEKDADLIPGLRARFPTLRRAQGDALTENWRELSGAGQGRLLVEGNIPYNIPSPLIDRRRLPPRPVRSVVRVQREVAARLAARPGTRAYGALTVGVQSVATVERVMTVPAGAFQPPPKVDSALVRLTPVEVPLVRDAWIPGHRRMVTALFAARRKQLGRAVRQLTGWGPERVVAMLEGMGLIPTDRAEVLTPLQFAALHARLVDEGWRSG